MNKILKLKPLFLLTVVLPTAMSIVYFGFVASDIYLSESRIIVRNPDRQIATGLGALLKSAGFSRSQDDSYTVRDYIMSRDALSQVDKKIGIRSVFSSQTVDIFSRFGALSSDKSFEELYRFYRKKIDVEQDAVSSIITLSVRSYTAQNAKLINESLLDLSENLVNRLNERGRADLINSAVSEVTNAGTKAKAAAYSLSVYRSAKNVLDPERQATMQLQQVAKLQDELIATKTQLAQLKKFTPENPQIPAMRLRVSTLRAEINIETGKATGGERSLANKAVEYERLVLERDFADKQLGSAFASLEVAKNEAQRKQVYVERIVQASLPDSAAEPRRFRGMAGTLIMGLMAFGILSLLISGVREHKD